MDIGYIRLYSRNAIFSDLYVNNRLFATDVHQKWQAHTPELTGLPVGLYKLSPRRSHQCPAPFWISPEHGRENTYLHPVAEAPSHKSIPFLNNLCIVHGNRRKIRRTKHAHHFDTLLRKALRNNKPVFLRILEQNTTPDYDPSKDD